MQPSIMIQPNLTLLTPKHPIAISAQSFSYLVILDFMLFTARCIVAVACAIAAMAAVRLQKRRRLHELPYPKVGGCQVNTHTKILARQALTRLIRSCAIDCHGQDQRMSIFWRFPMRASPWFFAHAKNSATSCSMLTDDRKLRRPRSCNVRS